MRGRVDWLLILLPKSSSSRWSVCVMAHFLGPPLQPLQLCAIPWPWLSPTPWQAKLEAGLQLAAQDRGQLEECGGDNQTCCQLLCPWARQTSPIITSNIVEHSPAMWQWLDNKVTQVSAFRCDFKCVCVCLLVRVHARMFMLRGNKISQKVNILVIYSCLLIWKKAKCLLSVEDTDQQQSLQ